MLADQRHPGGVAGAAAGAQPPARGGGRSRAQSHRLHRAPLRAAADAVLPAAPEGAADRACLQGHCHCRCDSLCSSSRKMLPSGWEKVEASTDRMLVEAKAVKHKLTCSRVDMSRGSLLLHRFQWLTGSAHYMQSEDDCCMRLLAIPVGCLCLTRHVYTMQAAGMGSLGRGLRRQRPPGTPPGRRASASSRRTRQSCR